ncbi:hypothetical protein T484DRAFT_1748907 [Baffinella frigidus]|nr:hypothetical protein T484DRAFT_1748907 [Cryptophyta sp. CCMP2293]
MAPTPNPINTPTQELKTGLDFERRNRFERLYDTTGRPKRVFRKTPPPPIIRGVSTSGSHDDLLDEHSPVLVSADFIRAVMRAVEVISAEHRFRPQHSPASHGEFLARRHAQHAPRVSSPEAKLTSSFLPADRASVHQVDDNCELLPRPCGSL